MTMTYVGHLVFGSQFVRLRIFWTSKSYSEQRYIYIRYNSVPLMATHDTGAVTDTESGD